MDAVHCPPVVVGLGELLWDVLSPTEKHLGGAPANFAFQASQLGATAIVVSAYGPDDHPLTAGIDTVLQALGVSGEGLRQVPHDTGTVTVTTRDGQPSYQIHEPVAWDFIPFDSGLEAIARRADAVCFGTLAQRRPHSRQTIKAFLKGTRRDCLRVFDINLRQHYYDASTIEGSLERADVLKLNSDELPEVARLLGLASGTADAVAADLLKRFELRLVALTRGGEGSSLYVPFRTSHHPGYPVAKVVDTIGAGDAFTAALVIGLLRSDDLDAVHDRAARLASFVCTQAGATPRLTPELRSAFSL